LRLLKNLEQAVPGLQVLEEILMRHVYSKVIYLGDGLGDFCPCTRLGAADFVLARENYPTGGYSLENMSSTGLPKGGLWLVPKHKCRCCFQCSSSCMCEKSMDKRGLK
jgi:hypothetical protein